jgi:hypothetical protein
MYFQRVRKSVWGWVADEVQSVQLLRDPHEMPLAKLELETSRLPADNRVLPLSFKRILI